MHPQKDMKTQEWLQFAQTEGTKILFSLFTLILAAFIVTQPERHQRNTNQASDSPSASVRSAVPQLQSISPTHKEDEKAHSPKKWSVKKTAMSPDKAVGPL